MDAIRMNQSAGLEPTAPLVALGERYISGEITFEEYGSTVASW
jgi:Antitoxin VbhA